MNRRVFGELVGIVLLPTLIGFALARDVIRVRIVKGVSLRTRIVMVFAGRCGPRGSRSSDPMTTHFHRAQFPRALTRGRRTAAPGGEPCRARN